jgi:two-component system chemotaxis family response regulator WspR
MQAPTRIIYLGEDDGEFMRMREDLVRSRFEPTFVRKEDFRDEPQLHEADLLLASGEFDFLLFEARGAEEVFKLFAAMRSKNLLDEPSVIVIAESFSLEDLHASFAAGAHDFMVAPVRPVELVARLRTNARLRQEILRRKARERELLQLNRQLADTTRMLAGLSIMDSLTGIPNRRQFDRVLHQEWRRAQRNGRWLGVALIDVDRFKLYNDNYGHRAGDEVLSRVAKALSQALFRAGDVVCRYGGEEFAIVLPDTDPKGAATVVGRMIEAVSDLGLGHEHNVPWQLVTASAGVHSVVPQERGSVEEFVSTADTRLYAAKSAGRNRVVAE